MFTTEEIINQINNLELKSISEFSKKLNQLYPDVTNFSIIDRKDMGVLGIKSVARFYNGDEEIIVKGFLYPNNEWSESVHGYITAKKL